MASKDGKPEKLRIVLVGSDGSGKSSTGNTILGRQAFTIGQSRDPETLTCQVESGEFEGTPVSVVDTPGTIRPNSTEMSKCISYSAPGPHAFLLVMPLDKFADVERQVKTLQQSFGEEASRYTIVLFTHGDELPDAVTIDQFICENPFPYGVGYHVFNRDEDPSQVRELLKKINTMVQRNGGSYCIKDKDWKHCLYLLANVVTTGSGIGAASRGTAEDLLIAVIGSALGAIAAAAGRNTAVAVAKAVFGAAVGAVFGVVAVAVLVAVVIEFGGDVAAVEVAVQCLAYAGVLAASIGVVVVAIYNIDVPGARFKAAVCAVAGAGVAFGALAVARPGAAAVGLADALRDGVVNGTENGTATMCLVDVLVNGTKIGVVNVTKIVYALRDGAVIGTGIAGKAAGAVSTGAGSAGAALKVFGDLGVRPEAIWGVIGGAAVGAGGAGFKAYADGPADHFDYVGAASAVVIGVIVVLFAVYVIVSKSDGTVNKIVGAAIVLVVSILAALGAAGGVLGAASFAVGVFIIIACKAVTWCLKKKD